MKTEKDRTRVNLLHGEYAPLCVFEEIGGLLQKITEFPFNEDAVRRDVTLALKHESKWNEVERWVYSYSEYDHEGRQVFFYDGSKPTS
jgi:hypothetical protein